MKNDHLLHFTIGDLEFIDYSNRMQKLVMFVFKQFLCQRQKENSSRFHLPNSIADEINNLFLCKRL